jgi:hypothetical protein
MDGADGIKSTALQAGGRSLIAKELEKSPRSEPSIIRAHCARMHHWTTSVHNGAAEKASVSPTGVQSTSYSTIRVPPGQAG